MLLETTKPPGKSASALGLSRGTDDNGLSPTIRCSRPLHHRAEAVPSRARNTTAQSACGHRVHLSKVRLRGSRSCGGCPFQPAYCGDPRGIVRKSRRTDSRSPGGAEAGASQPAFALDPDRRRWEPAFHRSQRLAVPLRPSTAAELPGTRVTGHSASLLRRHGDAGALRQLSGEALAAAELRRVHQHLPSPSVYVEVGH